MKFEVSVFETRELIFEVEASNIGEAEDIALDADTTLAVRDSFEAREVRWSGAL